MRAFLRNRTVLDCANPCYIAADRPVRNEILFPDKAQLRQIWLHAQRLDTPSRRRGAAGDRRAVVTSRLCADRHINVIERSHHIYSGPYPNYRRADLPPGLRVDKSVFDTEPMPYPM